MQLGAVQPALRFPHWLELAERQQLNHSAARSRVHLAGNRLDAKAVGLALGAQRLLARDVGLELLRPAFLSGFHLCGVIRRPPPFYGPATSVPAAPCAA
jgi:hypothetical protein